MPAMAAPTMITIDGIVERESGVTPPPPAITVKAIAITLLIMLLIGCGILAYLSSQPKPDFDSWPDASTSCRASAST
jgi:hypothetical protein